MRILWAIMTCLPLALSACSSDDAAKTEEPVAPAVEDPAAAPAPEGAPADEAAPPPETPGGELPADSVPPPASDTETIGELTESSAPAVAPTPAPATDEPPMPSESELAQPEPSRREKAISGKTVTRVVTATKLNVRSGPSRKSSVVRQLAKGDEVQAVIQGKFAKIGDGEYVRSKYLATKGKAAKGKGKKAKAKGKAKKAKKKAKKAAP